MGKVKTIADNFTVEEVTRDNREYVYKGQVFMALRTAKNGKRGDWSIIAVDDNCHGEVFNKTVKTADLPYVIAKAAGAVL